MYFAPPQNKMKTWLRACAHYRPVHNRSVMKVAIQDNCHFGQCVSHVTYKLSNSVSNIALRHVYRKVLAKQRLTASVLRYYCFNTALRKWVAVAAM